MKIRVVVVGIEGPINLGFIARLVKNFEADELFLVKPVAQVDETALRFAAHARDVLERVVIVESLDDALKDVAVSACTSARVGQKSDVLRHAVTPWELVEMVEGYSSVALVFGRESTGLTREEIAKCDLLVSIPASREYPVLNLSHAVGILLYEMFKKFRLKKSQFRIEPAREENIRVVIKRLECIAERVVKDERLAQVLPAIRHMVVKAGLTAGEASSLSYFLKKLALELGAEECIR
ncbi:RNA methyltransferase, TrmH family, group 1 [Pyrolobus fumarii 1A]|uniref:RNA methyltransferase, TrmH family, group 1 n=1 Tax=Pyrolobus fumarii (strain DSM 11204 / 1A) TaxID=694429 RepID=G0EES9_PYRF1|nr:TrmJ/YjtD family RNA methyltransferase [Pyrolobus fumarii]AEM38043.1 RNA methyltransferase, TrmH family, group 1 [Pyrolobus fumarii 1A]